jgi:hypothetical protein
MRSPIRAGSGRGSPARAARILSPHSQLVQICVGRSAPCNRKGPRAFLHAAFNPTSQRFRVRLSKGHEFRSVDMQMVLLVANDHDPERFELAAAALRSLRDLHGVPCYFASAPQAVATCARAHQLKIRDQPRVFLRRLFQ